MTDDPGLNGLLGVDRSVCAADLPRPNEEFRAKRKPAWMLHDSAISADGTTPLWSDGPWNDPGADPWERGKDWDLRRTYGLTIEQWAGLYVDQGGRCPGCRRTFRFTWQCPPGEPRPPHVDHDHETGEIRGLLCGRCNRALRQKLTRYVLNPPARRLSPLVMPAKQRQYGLELYAKRARRKQQSRDLAALTMTQGGT